MKIGRLRVRTLLIAVVVVAIGIELVGLGRRFRYFRAQAQAAVSAEQRNLQTIENLKLGAAQAREKADQIQATDPPAALGLRARADRLLTNIPFFEAQSKRAAASKLAWQQAVSRPWENPPPVEDRLTTTPPLGP